MAVSASRYVSPSAARPNETHSKKILVFMNVQILIYVHLWIVEGALRKWVPGTENLFYFARDIILVCSLAYAGLAFSSKQRRAPLLWIAAIVVVCFAAIQVILGRVDLMVAVIGLRSYISPFILVYAAWCYGTPSLYPRIAKIILIYTPVQALIAVMQVISPPLSWINKQVGSDGASFVNGGVARASGMFSSPAGLTMFIPLALAVVLWLLHDSTRKLKFAAVLVLISIIVLVAVSGSRGSVLGAAIVLSVFVVFQLFSLSGTGLRNMLLTIGFIFLALTWVLSTFPEVVSSFEDRFASAAQSEDSSDRLLGATFDFLGWPFRLLGDGVGNHSVAGINLGGTGPWHEIESIRWVTELGVLGWMLAASRILFSLVALFYALSHLRRRSILGLLVLAALLPVILFGQVTQFPSAQAFTSVCGAFLVLLYATPSIQIQEMTVQSGRRPYLNWERNCEGF